MKLGLVPKPFALKCRIAGLFSLSVQQRQKTAVAFLDAILCRLRLISILWCRRRKLRLRSLYNKACYMPSEPLSDMDKNEVVCVSFSEIRQLSKAWISSTLSLYLGSCVRIYIPSRLLLSAMTVSRDNYPFPKSSRAYTTAQLSIAKKAHNSNWYSQCPQTQPSLSSTTSKRPFYDTPSIPPTPTADSTSHQP